jgi:hypothetical protein
MYTYGACARKDLPDISSEKNARLLKTTASWVKWRAILPICCLLGPLAVEQRAFAGSELSPVQGRASIVNGRSIAGSEGALYRLPGGIRIALGPNAEASLAAQPQMLALTSGKRTPTFSVFLRSGRVDVDIPEKTFGAVAVAGPSDVRVIARRGRSSTLASGQSLYTLSEKYPLLVSQKERLATLAPGMVRQYSKNEPPTDRPALSAPRWLAGRQVWLALPEVAKISDFAWSPVNGATFYTVELRQAETGDLLGGFQQISTKIGETLPPLGPGNYQLSVRASDGIGLPGLNSAPLRLQIVGVNVPTGATLQPDARIELSRSQTVQLKNAEGLSLKRSRERLTRPASEPVGIADGRPTPILIQGKDLGAPCLIWLLPSQTPVSAHVGPKWVFWPHESVELEVRWSDSGGRRLSPDVEPTVTVLVGVEPVDVTWDKQTDVWHANLAPQPGRGPWVVRLEVHDQLGALLARDFVEVKQQPKRHAVAALTSFADAPPAR